MIMNLPAAYHTFDLPIGSSLEVVQVRYRQLVKKYHPDRFSSAQDKASAEEHLKRINEAKEVIQKHWFEAKIKASDPIPYGADEPARPVTTKPKAPRQSPPQTAPQSPPQRQFWWQQILQLLFAELQDFFKKFEKKLPLDDALEQLDKPFKFTSETKLRRAWYAVAIIIITDLVYIGYCENMERRKASSLEPQGQTQPQAQAQTRYLRGLTPVAEVINHSLSEQEQQKTAIYFKRLELDAAERAIRKDSELIDEIEIKLSSYDLANETRRSLERMKVFRELDKKQKEIERASILEELSQQGLSRQQPS
jgi:curved DNA-binding protein CbpA